jgi:hypothetical protein
MCFLSTFPFVIARMLNHCKSDNNHKNAVIRSDQTNQGRQCIVTPGLHILLLVVTKQHAVVDMGTLPQGKT